MIGLGILLASALAPSALLLWFFHARDRNPEPMRVVWATFGLGVLAILPVLAVAMPLSHYVDRVADPIAHGFLDALLTAGMPEELFKFLVVALYCSRHREFDEPMDGIVYGAVASLGFATLENVMYVTSGGAGTAVMRAFSSVPCHAAMGGIMGYYVGQARFGDPAQRRANWLRAYFIPALLHTLYDFPILSLQNVEKDGVSPAERMTVGLLVLVSIGVLVFEVVWVLRLVARLRRQQLSTAATSAATSTATSASMLASRPLPPGAEDASVSSVAHAPIPVIAHAPSAPALPSVASGIVRMVPGALLTTLGAAILLVMLLGLVAGDTSGRGDLLMLLILALPSLVGGQLLFRAGLRRL